MLRFRPVKNLCFIGDDFWFISRNINALFRYCNRSGMVECFHLIGDIRQDYAYLATHVYDGRIYLPPVYNKGFCEYDIETNQFRQILTPNSQRPCNFGVSFANGEDIFCVPNYVDGPFVTFSMKDCREIGNAFFFPKTFFSKECYPTIVRQGSNNLYYGLLYPLNIIYTLNSETGEFNFYNNTIKGQIESFFILDNYIYLATQDKIILTDLKINPLTEKRFDIHEKFYFIGDYGSGVFVDVPNSPIKWMVEYVGDNIVMNRFDESSTYISSPLNKCGFIQYNKRKNSYVYFSGSSNGFYEFTDDKMEFFSLELADDSRDRIQRRYLMSLCGGNIGQEGDVFGLAEFIKGVTKI